MPKYVAKSYLLHEGKIVRDGEEVELTSEQAERLGDKVQNPTVANNEEYEKPLEEYNVRELRDFADQKNIEGYYDMRKDELIEALKESE